MPSNATIRCQATEMHTYVPQNTYTIAQNSTAHNSPKLETNPNAQQ